MKWLINRKLFDEYLMKVCSEGREMSSVSCFVEKALPSRAKMSHYLA